MKSKYKVRRIDSRLSLAVRAAVEPLENRTLFATISGYVFLDNTSSHTSFDPPTDTGLAGWTVYLDSYHNGTNFDLPWTVGPNGSRDSAELSAVTDSAGFWTITTTVANCYTPKLVIRPGWTLSYETGYSGLSGTTDSTDNLFAFDVEGPPLPEVTTDAADTAANDECCGRCEDCDEVSSGPVRYGDGLMKEESTDLPVMTAVPWGHQRAWSNSDQYAGEAQNGNGWVVKQWPSLARSDDGSAVAWIMDGLRAEWFDGTTSFTARHGSKDTLELTGGEFILRTPEGKEYRFFDIDDNLYPANQRGSFKSYTDAAGNIVAAYSHDGDGNMTEVRSTVTDGVTTTIESFLYAYVSSGDNEGRLESVTYRTSTTGGSSWSTVRKAEYTYYGTSESYGNLGDLKLAAIKDASDNTLDTTYYRYYIDNASPGYTGGIQYVLYSEDYARALADLTTPLTATANQLAPYASKYYEYDAQHRVIEETVSAAGCSGCTGGFGTYTFSYETPSSHADGYNSWKYKTIETLPDGNQNIVYMNYLQKVMLKIFKNTTTSEEWKEYTQYDSAGRVVLTAQPSAVSGYWEAAADLLTNPSDPPDAELEGLRDNRGLIEVTAYGTSTTATSSTAGDVIGYVKSVSLKHGESATAIKQQERTYKSRTAQGQTIYPVVSKTVYRNENADAQTTTYSHVWYGDDTPSDPDDDLLQAYSISTTLPTVTTAQNGPNAAVTLVSVFDTYGRTTWTKDGDGFINHIEYDAATGAIITQIVDVNTSSVTDEPSGWTTPGGGGLHLTSAYEVDHLGRATKATDPKGNITYMVYKDTVYETRVYRGWTGSTTTGPTIVMRQDRGRKYTETFTMSATPDVSASKPTGNEAVSSVQSLSRTYINNASQVVKSDVYVSMPGGSYSVNADFGSLGTNYHRTTYDYDTRGWQKRVVNPNGTINWTLYDGLGRAKSQWVGTDDTGAINGDPDGSGGANNMLKVAEFEYDGGQIGDSFLTKQTLYPLGGADARVTEFYGDWRGRTIATKSGVQGSESSSTGVQRMISYIALDNLGQPTASYVYDGDNENITRVAEELASGGDTDGVPNAPTASKLRAKTEVSFDESGQIYESRSFSVDNTTGSVSGSSLKMQNWYDKRGNLVKSLQPGGIVSKSQYDGAGRTTKSFVTDGGGDPAAGAASNWDHADDVTGDKVLEQAAYTYDANSNVILTTVKQRFHDETGTGELGDASTAPKARVSYMASYYDAIDRVTESVDVGTNAGSSYTRPGSAPSRSDTVLVTSYTYDAAGRLLEVSDPKSIETRYTYDLRGQTLSVTENYVNGSPGDSDDRITLYTYDGNGNVLTMTADTSGTDQVTQYVYGVTTGGGSDINSNDILKEVRYPDASTGAASTSASDKEQYTYNALGQVKTMTDQNGNVHTYSYDVLGRLTIDAVTTLGSGVDGTVRRQEVRYNTQGLADQFTQYNAASSGTVVNQVEREFNGLGQLRKEWQQISGSVTSSTLRVEYNYSEMSGGANHSRLLSVRYPTNAVPPATPTSRLLRYEYMSGLDADISRVSFLADDSSGSVGTHLEEYSYLGLSTIVERKHPEPNLDLSFVKQTAEGTGDAGDQYTGLDRFGRVVDQRWFDRRASGQTDDRETDRFRYAYDRDSNRVSREWDSYSMPSTFKGDEAYFYDDLNRLNKANRGTLASGTITDGNATWAQQWDNTGATGSGYDALGNWKAVTTDTNGGVAGSATTQTRTHNSQNQIATISGATSPTYDDAGSLTKDETGVQYTYDAWGRTIKVKTSGGSDKVTYTLDALGRRVAQDVTGSGVGTDTQYYYSANWQVLEEREHDGSNYVARWQNVWSLAYIDALAVRDTLDATAAGSLDNSFSGDGKYTHSLASVDIVRAVQQADGKIVAIGDVGGDVGLARFNADGSLDTAFDGNGGSGNGFFTTDFGGTDQGLGVTIDNNGKIIVVGFTSSGSDLLIARYNGSNGVLDTSFDTDGKKIIDIAGLTGSASDVIVQPDGKILIAGTNGGDMLVGRLNDNGSWDTSYNTVGYLKVNFSGTDRGFQMALDHDGKAVVVGDTTTGTGGDFTVIRVNTNGTLDTSFDTDGKQTTSFSAGQDGARGVAIDSQNRIVVGGQGGGDFQVARYTTAGALDTTFDTDGKQSININGTDDGEDLVLDGSGRILISGSANTNTDFGIARLTAAGALDTTFSGDGKQTVDFAGGATVEECETMLVQADGRIVLAGASGSNFAVARLSGGGARHYIVQDANYNVTAVVEAGATVADRYQYTPYGVWTALNADFSTDLDGSGEVYQGFYYQGLRYDGNSGNHHARNRDYRATLGRWTQNDPAGYVDGASSYQFVRSDPTSFLDPFGLVPKPSGQIIQPATGVNCHGHSLGVVGGNAQLAIDRQVPGYVNRPPSHWQAIASNMATPQQAADHNNNVLPAATNSASYQAAVAATGTQNPGGIDTNKLFQFALLMEIFADLKNRGCTPKYLEACDLSGPDGEGGQPDGGGVEITPDFQEKKKYFGEKVVPDAKPCDFVLLLKRQVLSNGAVVFEPVHSATFTKKGKWESVYGGGGPLILTDHPGHGPQPGGKWGEFDFEMMLSFSCQKCQCVTDKN